MTVSLEVARERVVQALCAHYAQDRLTTEELESRLERAQRAAGDAQLAALVSDLPALPDVPVPFPSAPGAAPAPIPPSRAPTRPPAPSGMPAAYAGPRAEHERQLAIMFGFSRRGVWTPPEELEIVTVMGGAELDFREALLGPVTEVSIFAVMGGVEIIVPPGVRLEVSGNGIMGGFGQSGGTRASFDPNTPLIRVTGFAIMGGVEVSVRLPGESARDAKRREREDARLLRGGR